MEYTEFDWNVITLSVSNELFFSAEAVINDTDCVFNFGYNSRLNKRWFNIKNVNGSVILRDTFITLTNVIIPTNYFNLIGNYKTEIYFRKKDTSYPLDILDWEDNVEIFIISIPPENKEQAIFNEKYLNFVEL